MPNKFADVTPRSFNPMSSPALSGEAQKAVTAAFDAMSTWRVETVKNNEKNAERVIEKMAEAARALGWPADIVEATRAQIQSLTKMQVETMDYVMDAWEAQIKSPNPASTMLSKLKSLPTFGQTGTWPGADGSQAATLDPFRAYMQFAQQWQKAWADGMAAWTKPRLSS